MDSIDQYQSEAYRTASGDAEAIADRIKVLPQNLLHSILGMQDELGEIAKVVKAFIFYGRPIDVVNLAEEYGDQQWFWSLGVHSLGMRNSDVLQTNIDKLKKRFPDGFSEESANNRDLEAEREILEGDKIDKVKLAAKHVSDAIKALTPIGIHLDTGAATQIVSARSMCEDAFEILEGIKVTK